MEAHLCGDLFSCLGQEMSVSHPSLHCFKGKTGAITYLVDHVLSFTRVAEGVVIVNAPDDALFDLAVATSTALANLQPEQLRQSAAIRAVHGAY